MDLKSGRLYWPEAERPAPGHVFTPDQVRRNSAPAPLLNSTVSAARKPLPDMRCDVAVIGAGITGAMVAYHLAQRGVEVIVLDRRAPASGSTSASTALLMYELDEPLVSLMDKVGAEHAVRAYRACEAAVDGIDRLAREAGVDCAYARRPSLLLASSAEDAEELRREYEVRRQYDFALEWLSQPQIEARYGFNRPAALLTPHAAEVDPYRLTQALLARTAQRGARVLGETTLTNYAAGADGVVIETDRGATIRARKIVFATGYETMHFLKRDVVKLLSSYAITSQPIGDFGPWRDRCLIWETAHPYLYLRTTPDGRAMVGGADEEFANPEARDALIAEKSRTLREQFHSLFPQIEFEIEYAWAGTFGETEDSMPYVGALPEYPHAYFSLSYGANGVLFSLLAAEIIRDLYLGERNGLAEVFSFGRDTNKRSEG